MKILVLATPPLALLLAGGEFARWWGDPRIVPMAFDELAVALALLAACFAPHGWRPPALTAAWALYSGLMLGLLVPTLDHLLHGPPKESADFYAVILSVMLLIGVLATSLGLRACRARQRGR